MQTMFIERFSPIPKRTLVSARGSVARVNDDHHNNGENLDRRKQKDRRRKTIPISFKDRRKSKDRRNSDPVKKNARKDNKTVGTFVDIRV